MRFVSIEDARPGMCLAYDLYDSMGRTMVGSGCELTASYINKLNEYGFSGIYIEDEQSKDIYIEATIPEKLRHKGLNVCRRMILTVVPRLHNRLWRIFCPGKCVSGYDGSALIR